VQAFEINIEDRSLMDFIEGEVRSAFEKPESPRYLFPLSDAVQCLFDVLHHRLGDSELDGVGTQVLQAFASYRDRSDFLNLPDRLEAFLKFTQRLLKPAGPEYLENTASRERMFLPEVLQALGLANASTVGNQTLAQLEGKPRFAWYVERAVQARNQVHRAPTYSARERAEVFESVCVVLLFAICESRRKIGLALLASRHCRLLQRYREDFDKWRERFVDLEGSERLTDEFEGIDPLAVELIEDDSVQENDTDENPETDEIGAMDSVNSLADSVSEQRRGLVRDLVRDIPKLVLLGDPGAGKTTTLQYLAWQAATGLLKKPSGERWFPIYIPLKALASGDSRSLDAIVHTTMGGASIKQLANQGCMFLLDGLNEVPQEHLAAAKQEIQSLISLGDNVRIILTCRPGQFQNEFSLPVFELQSLRDEQILRFFQRHLRDDNKVGKLLSIIKRQPKLLEWARNPFMLAMLVRGFLKHGSLPENRGKLMQGFLCDIMRREQAQGAAKTPLETKTTLLAHLAFETRKLAVLSFTRIEACTFVKQRRDDLGSTLDVPLFIDEVLNNNFLAETTGGLLTFDHELYQEYFCAVALVEMGTGGIALVEELQQEPRWEEPIVLFSGISDNRSSILRSLATSNVHLAARSLASSSLSEKKDREFILQQARELASTAGDPAKIAQGLLSLAELGEAEAMITVLKQRGAQDAIAQRAIQSFIPRCSPELVVDWIRRTSDHSDKFLIRWMFAAIAPDQKDVLLRDYRETFKELLLGQFRGARLDKRTERTHLQRILVFLGDDLKKWMRDSIAKDILKSSEIGGSEYLWQAFSHLWSENSDLGKAAKPPALLAAALNRPGRYSIEAALQIWLRYFQETGLTFLFETVGEYRLELSMRFLRRYKSLDHHRLSLAISEMLREYRARCFSQDPALLKTTISRLECLANIHVGEVRKCCTVVAIKHFGYFIELEPGINALLHPSDVTWTKTPTDALTLEVNQSVDVVVLEVDDARGTVVVGLKQIIFIHWMNAESRYPFGTKVRGKVLRVGTGKALVQLDPCVEGLIDRTDMSWDSSVKPSDLLTVGNDVEAVVIGKDSSGLVFLLSTRLLQPDPWEKIEAVYPIGTIVAGKILNIVDFGVFVRLPSGIHGLLHKDDMSWGRVEHPSSLVSVGQDLDFVVLDIKKERKRISLGLKQKITNPWDNIETKYSVGAKVEGKVVKLVPYGAFVQLEPGVEGLVHITELSWKKRIAKPSDVLKQDQGIEAIVLGINREEQKISLGIRQLESNPWDTAETKYPVGTRVKGKVRNLTSYGAFVELEDGIDGMIHVSDVSWARKINHPSEVLKKGDEVEMIVLEVDHPNQRIALGMKQLVQDPWERIDMLYKVGDVVTGKVTKLASFGAFVGLQHDIDGLVHISQVREERVDKIKTVLKVGQDVTARVIKIDKGEHRIGLSIKAASYSDEQLKEEQKIFDTLKPGEDLLALQQAFDDADEPKQEPEE
jgi:small subunit ribosomal protein S1